MQHICHQGDLRALPVVPGVAIFFLHFDKVPLLTELMISMSLFHQYFGFKLW